MPLVDTVTAEQQLQRELLPSERSCGAAPSHTAGRRPRLWDFPLGAAAADTGEILLPAVIDPGAFRHEVGHPIAHANGDEFGRRFELISWHEGWPRRQTVSAHAATSPGEDFAERYRAHRPLLPEVQAPFTRKELVWGPASYQSDARRRVARS